MVAYSFMTRFVDPILAGSKTQTIRADRKRHARPGETLQLYAGMRTRHCRLIATACCVTVEPIRLSFHRRFGPTTFVVGGVLLGCDAMEAFAQADGFGRDGIAVLDMAAFWFGATDREADEIDFRGVVVRWRSLMPTEATR